MTDDDLDNQLRGAMKVLDAEVPSGYFEGLPQRTLARLEDRSMEPSTTTGPRKIEAAAPPPAAPEQREEDSGLHDIRSLAQSTKQRLSKKITAVPPMDEDVLASSSAGWKAVALPEPAKMISLPELDQLPSKKQIKEQQKAAKAKAVEAAPAVRAPTHLEDSAPVAKAAPAASMSFGANIVGQKKSKAPLYALVGMGLAAAAGAAIYVATQGSGKSAPAPAAAPVVAKAETPPPPAAPAQIAAPATPPPVEAAAATGSAAEPTPPPADVPVVAAVPSKKGKPSKPDATMSKKVGTSVEAKPEVKKPEPPKGAVGKEAPKDGEPNFDDLLKEAGVKDGQKVKKPVLDKKSLSGSDFKAGMNSIAGKAAACYAGTQGTAAVKLTVAPSGQVTKASVSGPFAGTAVAACVEAAVRGASFPAWEGGPQSFNYSFLLAE